MVRVARRERTAIYVVLEDERPIGQVVAPAGEPVLARGAETVLLVRDRGRGASAAA